MYLLIKINVQFEQHVKVLHCEGDIRHVIYFAPEEILSEKGRQFSHAQTSKPEKFSWS